MKAHSPSLVAATIIAAGSIGYSAYTSVQVRDLERRLNRAETTLQCHARSLEGIASANIHSLEARHQEAELLAPRPQSIHNATSVLEQRITKVEQQIKPHLEVLPRYVPDN